MNLTDLQLIFNRAVSLTFIKKKLLLTFVILAFCGILVVFFRGIALHTGNWISMSLTFIPIFACTALLLSMGIILIRVYHDEVKKQVSSYREVLKESWDIVLGVSYFTVPLILCYLLLWMTLGVFVLIREIPTLGDFFGVVLAFAPFILQVGSLALCLLSIALLFFVTPMAALRGLNRSYVSQVIIERIRADLFSNLLLAWIALIPLIFVVGILTIAALMTDSVMSNPDSPLHVTLQWFFIMIPFTAVLAPAVVFFFNFAAEAHVLLMKTMNNE